VFLKRGRGGGRGRGSYVSEVGSGLRHDIVRGRS
jgi:hypothetical protein